MGRSLVACLLLASLLGCSRERDDPPPALQASVPREEKAFVVFSRTELVIDTLGAPIPVPVTVGSSPSAATLSSDSPDVVSVDGNGALVAYRNGIAVVRAASGASLRVQVDVVDVRSLFIEPRRLVLRAGATGRLRLLAGPEKHEIPPDRIGWRTSDPGVATLLGSEVMAGPRPGRARITARFGGQEAEAVIVVGSPSSKGRWE